MNRTMWRVLATLWEAETSIECWCRTKDEAELIVNSLRRNQSLGDMTVQIDPPGPPSICQKCGGPVRNPRDHKCRVTPVGADDWTTEEILAREG